jgi:hypothetical protein
VAVAVVCWLLLVVTYLSWRPDKRVYYSIKSQVQKNLRRIPTKMIKKIFGAATSEASNVAHKTSKLSHPTNFFCISVQSSYFPLNAIWEWKCTSSNTGSHFQSVQYNNNILVSACVSLVTSFISGTVSSASVSTHNRSNVRSVS